MTIKQARARRGLTQAETTFLAGVGIANLTRLEAGVQKLTPGMAAKLARALGVDVDALLRGQQQLQEERRRELAGVG